MIRLTGVRHPCDAAPPSGVSGVEGSEKGRSGPTRACLTGALLSILLILSLVGFAFWFLQSPHFLDLLHRELARRFGTDVRIGSLDLQNGSVLVIRDLTVGDVHNGPASIGLPFAAVGFSFRGLRQGRLDSVTLRNPRLSLRPGRAEGRSPGEGRMSLPVNLGRLVVEDGDVVLHFAERTLRGGVSFDARMDGKNGASTLLFSGGIGTVAVSDSGAAGAGQKGGAGTELLRSLTVRGKLTSVAPHRVALEASVRTDGLSLGSLQDDLLLPLGFSERALSVTGLLGAHITLAGTSPGELQWNSDIRVDGVVLSLGEWGVDLHGAPLHLQLEGAYSEETDRLRCRRLEARLGDHPPWLLGGDITDAASENPGFDLQLEGAGFPLPVLKELPAGPGLQWLQALKMTGQAAVRVALSGRAASPRIAGVVQLDGAQWEAAGIRLEPYEMEIPFACELGECLVRDARVSGKTVLFDAEQGRGLRTGLVNGQLVVPRLRFSQGALRAPGAALLADRITITRGGRPYLSESTPALAGDLSIDLAKKRMTLANYRLRSGGLGEITGDIDSTLGESVTVHATAQHRGLNVGRVVARLPKSVFSGSDYSLEGTAGLRTVWRMRIPRRGAPAVQGEVDVTLRDGRLASPDGTRVAAGVHAQGSGRVDFSLPMTSVAFTLQTRVSTLEMLWGSFYGDFSQRPIRLKVEGVYRPETNRLDVSRFNLALTDLGSLNVTGSVWNMHDTPAFDARVRLDGLSNGDAYDFFVRETFQESYPLLTTLHLDGRTDVDLTVRGTRQRMGVRGEVRVADMNLKSEPAGISLEGLQLLLPVHVAEDRLSANVPERTGSLRVSNIAWKALQTGPLELFPAIRQDVLDFRGDVALPLFGGRAVFKEMAYRNLFRPERTLRLSAEMEDFDLSRMSVAFGLPRFQGTLSGSIPSVTFAGRQLRTTGAIVLRLFGGEVTIEGISIHNVFSPVTSMESTVVLREIDLGRLTDTFEFGHISGILEGYVKDLVITNGQPEHFLVHLGTVERKGVAQRISVEALEKISILGSGASPSIFGRGVYRLFKEYRYAKLGFSGRLRNDNFTLRGIVREGDLEYLVRGGVLPPKVNVINYTQEISFREMLKRLKRVQHAGEAETSPRE